MNAVLLEYLSASAPQANDPANANSSNTAAVRQNANPVFEGLVNIDRA